MNTVNLNALDSYIGQPKIKELLKIYIKSAEMKNAPLPHCLISGTAGQGKTTLSKLIATALGSQQKVLFGTLLNKVSDITGPLLQLKDNDVLFIDEVHAISKDVMELLYPVIENNVLDVKVNNRMVRLNLAKFTLIGATTSTGLLSQSFKDRFGLILKLEPYTSEDITTIIKQAGPELDDVVCVNIAQVSRNTPRIAVRLVQRIKDYALSKSAAAVTMEHVTATLEMLNIDWDGLNETDRKMLMLLAEKSKPCGLETLSATLNEDIVTLEYEYEPYLLQKGYIEKTSQGRVVTEKGRQKVRTLLTSSTIDK